jgi:hypothetical protein
MQIHPHRLTEQLKKRNSLNITEITILNNMKNNQIQVSWQAILPRMSTDQRSTTQETSEHYYYHGKKFTACLLPPFMIYYQDQHNIMF